MHLIRYQESMLALHRSAIEGLTLGMSRQQDEADLVAVEEFYRKHGYQEIGQSFYGAVETVQFSKTLDERVCESAT